MITYLEKEIRKIKKEGREEGLQEGQQERNVSLAIAMLRKGFDSPGKPKTDPASFFKILWKTTPIRADSEVCPYHRGTTKTTKCPRFW